MFRGTADVLLLIAGFCSTFAVVLSALLIRRHLLFFSRPVVQAALEPGIALGVQDVEAKVLMVSSARPLLSSISIWASHIRQGKIIGILWMVPIYAVDSFVSLRFKDWALYVDMLRDCYEGYALYLFLALMVGYLGDGDEYKVVDILERCPPRDHAWPMGWFAKGPLPHGRDFLRYAKFGTMQYSVIKPATAAMVLVTAPMGLYKEGEFSVTGSWLYLSFVVNLSVCYAFYCLGMFYYVLKAPLKPYDPMPKFLCIKAVLFLSFWQGIVIAGLGKIDMVHGAGSWTAENVEKGIQDLLICVEMLLIAIAHTSAFPTGPYEDGATLRDGASLLEAHFAHHSAIRDFNEVMPVVLPSGFRPGPARTMVRIPVGERGSVAAWRASDGAASTLFMPKEEARFLHTRDVEVYKEVDDRLEDLDSLRRGLLSIQEREDEGVEAATGDAGGDGDGASAETDR